MTKKELTPREYEEIVSTGKAQSATNPNYVKYVVIAIAAIVLCGVSFGAGIGYQKGRQPTSTASSTNENGQLPAQGGRPGGMGGFRNGQRPNIGVVKTLTSDSITIANQRTGSDQTFKITSNTTVQNNGTTASISDVKTGDTVFITTDSTDSTTATQVMLNPSFGSPQG